MIELYTSNSIIEIEAGTEGIRPGWRVRVVPEAESDSSIEEEGFGNFLEISPIDNKLRVYDDRGLLNVHLILTIEPILFIVFTESIVS